MKKSGLIHLFKYVNQSGTQTLKQEGFVPVRVEVLPLDLGLQLVLLVRQQVDFDEGVRGAGEVLCGQFLASEHLDGEGGVLEAVAYAELDAAQLLADWSLAVVVLRTWGELRATNKRRQVNALHTGDVSVAPVW